MFAVASCGTVDAAPSSLPPLAVLQARDFSRCFNNGLYLADTSLPLLC